MTIYVNWEDHVILNEVQYENKVHEIARPMIDDAEKLDEFIDNNFEPSDVYHFFREGEHSVRENILDAFADECYTIVDETIGFERVEVPNEDEDEDVYEEEREEMDED